MPRHLGRDLSLSEARLAGSRSGSCRLMKSRTQYPFTYKLEVGIMAMLLKDPTLYDKYYGVRKSEYFHNGQLSSIFHVFERFKETNNEHPTLDTLINFILLGAEEN